MHDPAHPGEILRALHIEPLGLSVTEVAKGLGVSRKTLSALLNGRARMTAVLAWRVAQAFGQTPESWLAIQNLRDVWEVSRVKGPRVRPFGSRPAKPLARAA